MSPLRSATALQKPASSWSAARSTHQRAPHPSTTSITSITFILSTLFILSTARADDVFFPLASFTSTSVANRKVLLTPLSLEPATNQVAIYDPRMFTSDTNGTITVSNMIQGLYRADIQAPPKLTSFYFFVASNGFAGTPGASPGLVWANTIQRAVPQSVKTPQDYSYTAQASDARYLTVQASFLPLSGTNILASSLPILALNSNALWLVTNRAGLQPASANLTAYSLYPTNSFVGSSSGRGTNTAILNNGVSVLQTNIISAAAMGCVFDAVVTNGYNVDVEDNISGVAGTDNTALLQSILNRAAATNRTLELVIEGRAAVTGLIVYSNTTIRMLEGAGLYRLNDEAAAKPILRNANPTTNAIIDSNISLIGGTYYANGDWAGGGWGANDPNIKNYFFGAMGFFGIQNLTLRGIKIVNTDFATVQYGASFCNWSNVFIEDCEIRAGTAPGKDGFHFFAGSRLILRNCWGQTGSDFVALNSSDYHQGFIESFSTWVKPDGNITDVLIDGIYLDHSANGIGILAARNTVDNITVRNVSGIAREYMVSLWNAWPTNYSGGKIGTVLLDNISATGSDPGASGTASIVWVGAYDTGTNYVDSLQVRNCRWVNSPDNRPWLRIGPRTQLRSLSLAGMAVLESPANTNAHALVNLQSADSFIQHCLLSDISWMRPSTASAASHILSASGPITNLTMVNLMTYKLSGLTNGGSGIVTIATNCIIQK